MQILLVIGNGYGWNKTDEKENSTKITHKTWIKNWKCGADILLSDYIPKLTTFYFFSSIGNS